MFSVASGAGQRYESSSIVILLDRRQGFVARGGGQPPRSALSHGA